MYTLRIPLVDAAQLRHVESTRLHQLALRKRRLRAQSLRRIRIIRLSFAPRAGTTFGHAHDVTSQITATESMTRELTRMRKQFVYRAVLYAIGVGIERPKSPTQILYTVSIVTIL
jgi:hypothetical protein